MEGVARAEQREVPGARYKDQRARYFIHLFCMGKWPDSIFLLKNGENSMTFDPILV